LRWGCREVFGNPRFKKTAVKNARFSARKSKDIFTEIVREEQDPIFDIPKSPNLPIKDPPRQQKVNSLTPIAEATRALLTAHAQEYTPRERRHRNASPPQTCFDERHMRFLHA